MSGQNPMNRAFAIAALAAGLFAFAGSTNATASDYFHGGQHGYSGGHHGGNHHAGYGHAPVQTHGNSGYSSNYGGYGYGQTYQPSYQRSYQPSYQRSYQRSYQSSYQPRYQQQYAPTYQSQPYRQRGGLHIDIGRFHVLGAGGHH